jgi:L-histidine N-alpha-methyltransferase
MRLNRELGANFDVDNFRHEARYSVVRERIETSIVSRHDQVVHVAGQPIHFGKDEHVHVEISQKYTDDSIAALTARAGLRVLRTWKDPASAFALVLVAPCAKGSRHVS